MSAESGHDNQRSPVFSSLASTQCTVNNLNIRKSTSICLNDALRRTRNLEMWKTFEAYMSFRKGIFCEKSGTSDISPNSGIGLGAIGFLRPMDTTVEETHRMYLTSMWLRWTCCSIFPARRQLTGTAFSRQFVPTQHSSPIGVYWKRCCKRSSLDGFRFMEKHAGRSWRPC